MVTTETVKFMTAIIIYDNLQIYRPRLVNPQRLAIIVVDNMLSYDGHSGLLWIALSTTVKNGPS
jgi:hypothetical protein